MAKLIFVTGGSASGKTTIAKQIEEAFGEDALLISQDMFYLPTKSKDVNYDIPSAFDWELQKKFLQKIKNDEPAEMPLYSYEKYDRVGWETKEPRKVVVFEGLFTFWDEEIAKMADLQIFVDTPSDTRLARRILRDIKIRNRDPIDVIMRWQKDVQPSFLQYVSTMKKYADIIIPWEKAKDKSVFALISTIKALDKV